MGYLLSLGLAAFLVAGNAIAENEPEKKLEKPVIPPQIQGDFMWPPYNPNTKPDFSGMGPIFESGGPGMPHIVVNAEDALIRHECGKLVRKGAVIPPSPDRN